MADNNQQNNQQNAPAEDVGRLRQVRRDKLSFKSSQIGSAGEFNSSNFKKLSESVNVGISGKKAGAKIFS